MLFKAIDSYDHNGTTWASWWNVYKKKTCYRTNLGEVVAYGCVDNYIEDGEKVIEFSDLVATGGYCNGFRGGKIPTPSEPVSIEEQFEVPKNEWFHPVNLRFKNGLSIEAIPNKDVIRSKVERAMQEFLNIGCCRTIIPKEEKKMPTKFTFYVTEGTRVDKSCNGTIPTMTTTVEANSYSRTAPVGTATCDKADFDMRQGVLEALANMYCDGDFDKVFNKAVKRNELADKKKCTCKYCGKVFDTIEEREAEEAWHVDRKKARRERYLLRKRAKEIAFEEAAQKLAKEIIAEGNKK